MTTTNICTEEMLTVASAPGVSPTITPVWTGDNVNFGSWDGQAVRLTPLTAPVSVTNLTAVAIAVTNDTANGTGSTISVWAHLIDNTNVYLADAATYEETGNYTFDYGGSFSDGIQYFQTTVTALGGAYVSYFGLDDWTDSSPTPSWDGTKYAGLTFDFTIIPVGTWADGFRPELCRITFDILELPAFEGLILKLNGSNFSTYPDPLVFGVTAWTIDISALNADITSLGFFFPTGLLDYDVTNIEFFISEPPTQDTTITSLALTYTTPDPIPRITSMDQTVPINRIVEMLPNVIGLGGDSLGANAVFLTTDVRIPINTVQDFTSAEAVGVFFGYETDEYRMAVRYFAGFDTASIRPSLLYFAQYNTTDVAAYVRGGAITLAQLQALTTGTLTATINGVAVTSGTIDLTAVTTFNGALTVINAGFTAEGFNDEVVVTFDANASAFVFTSVDTGAASTTTFIGGTLAAGLKMTAATGAVISQGADILVGSEFMDNLVLLNQNWITFTTVNKLVTTAEGSGRCSQLMLWAASKERYLYAGWATTTADAIAFTEYADLLGLGFSISHYGENSDIAAAFCGMVAAINFDAENGTIVFANKYQSGLEPSVFDGTTFDELKAARVNFYARMGLDNSQENAYIEGAMAGGEWPWADSVINQIFFMSQLQKSQFYLLRQVNKVPFNAYGQGLTSGANRDPINQALTNGTIQPGITLSEAQKVEIKSIVGTQYGAAAVAQLESIGWYEKIDYRSLAARASRNLPVSIFYTDGGGVHTLTMPVYNIQ